MKYLVMTSRTPNFDSNIIDQHYEFLDELRSQNRLQMFGPFTDKSGGAYVITANNFEEATNIAKQDPVYTSNSSTIKVYEWNVR